MEFTVTVAEWVIELFAGFGALVLLIKVAEMLVDWQHKKLMRKQWKDEDRRRRQG